MKLFSEIDKTNLYPNQVDQALQTTINDWFQLREVCDDDNFPIYFRRVLNRDYGRYLQILRIEPEISEYDWLVEMYHESKTEHITSGSENNDESSTLTHGKSTTVVDSSGHTGDVTTTHSQLEADNYNNRIIKESGTSNSTNKHVQDEASNFDNRVIKESGTSSDSSTRKQDSDNNFDSTTSSTNESSSGSSTRTDNLSEKNDGTTKTTLNQGYADNVVQLTKQNPQSISYSDTNISSGSNGMPGLDWHYATTQGQNVTEHTIIGKDPDLTENNSTKTNSGTQKTDNSSESSGSGTNKTAYNRDETTTSSGSTGRDASDKVGYARDETTTDSGSTDRDASDKIGFNRNETNRVEYGDTITKNSTSTDSGDDVTKTNGSKTSEVTDNNYNITTGRSGFRSMSDILSSASNFIMKTSAWEWLEPRLEVCFMGVYDV